jgi:hypothetical protein
LSVARISVGEQAFELDGQQHLDVAGEHPDVAALRDLQLKVENLERALASQRTIGIVIGVLAERYQCTTSDAWAYLRRLSQSLNIKVRDIARVLQGACDGSIDAADAELAATLDDRLPGGLPGRGVRIRQTR